MLHRNYSRAIKQGLAHFPALALLGPRQIGKSTMARSFLSNRKVIFLDLEISSNRNRLNDPETFFKEHREELVIIDEIQTMPMFINGRS